LTGVLLNLFGMEFDIAVNSDIIQFQTHNIVAGFSASRIWSKVLHEVESCPTENLKGQGMDRWGFCLGNAPSITMVKSKASPKMTHQSRVIGLHLWVSRQE